MSYLACLLLASSLVSTLGQQSVETIRALLSEATYDVLGQHSEEMSRWAPPQEFNPPHGFMRSFVPGTGVGNREELSIDAIREVNVFHDTNFDRWLHRRFNNTNFLLGMRSRGVMLKRMMDDSAGDDYFTLSADDAVFNFIADSMSDVKDVAMFTRFSKYTPVLHVAILTESARASVVHIYEIVWERGAPVGVIDLGINPATSQFSAKKITFVHSQYGESLVVLINSPDVAKVVYQQKGSFELNHYIEVYYPSAVDIAAFTINSHGYIATANATFCEIIKLNEFAKGHVLFDRFYTPLGDAVDLEYFRLGFHHYLAVSGSGAQHLYVHQRAEFFLKQHFDASGVTRLYSANLPTCRDDVVLLFIKENSVEIYVFSGREEKFVSFDTAIPSNFRISPDSVTSFTHHHKAALLFLDPEGTLMAFVVETRLGPVSNPVIEAGKRITKYMKEIQDTLEEQTRQVQTIRDVLRDAVRTSGDQRISAFQTFEHLHSREGAAVHHIRQPVHIEWEDSELTLREYREGTEALEGSVLRLEKIVEDIERIIPDVVRTDEKTVITGSKKFTGDISGASILALAVNLQNAAGVNVPVLQKDIYRLDKPQQIQGTLSFAKPLSISGNLDVDGTINGIDISNDVMTTDTEQVSDASMLFKNKLVIQGDLHVSGKINDLDIGEEVVTLGGSHAITGRKSFLNGIQANSVATDLLDGVDVNHLYEAALSKSRDQNVTGTITFGGGLLTNDIVIHGYLNGYNVTQLAEEIVRVDRPAHITGHKAFLDDVSVSSTLNVDGTVNGLRIPDDLFLTDVEQTVRGYKEFTGTVTAHNVIVTGTVDDLVIPEDVVTLSGDEEVSSDLHFTGGIDADGDIVVEGLVDGVDISEVAREALKLNETSEFKHGIFFGPVTITGDLAVGGMVNKVKLSGVVGDIVYKNDEDVVVESQKTFKKVVTETVKLEDGMINGYNVDVDFMKVDGDQVITGIKTFKQPVTFNSLTIQDGMIGGLNITKLYENRISLIIEDYIQEDVEFADEVIVDGNLVVKGRIGGLAIPGDVVLKNSAEPIANKAFTNLAKVDNLVVGGDAHVSGTFSGVHLNELYNDRISLDQEQEIEGDLWLGNSAIENLELAGLVNGVDLKEFARNVMSKTKDQEVVAEKVFAGQTVINGPITTEEGVNGIHLATLSDRAFKLYGENYVTEPMEFDDISVKDVSVVGHVNGVNLTHLAEDSMKKLGPQHVTGVHIFEAGFHVDGDIAAVTVNDLVLSSSVLLRDVPQTITGQFTLGSLSVAGDLHVDGLVNGLDLSDIHPRLAKADQDEMVIESNVTFVGPVHVYQDVQVSGLVNGIDFGRLQDSVLLREGDQHIAGNKVVRGSLTVRGDVDVGHVNGVDWKAFLADVVRIDVPQVIRSPKTFINDVEVNSLNTDVASVQLLNGRRLEEVVEDAVLIDVPANITGPKVFKRTVEVTGDLNAELINGLRLKTDVITLTCNDGGPQVVTGQKSFENLTSYADIDIGGTVNSYHLYDLFKDTLLTEGDQTVLGKKTMLGEATFLGDVFAETVNGMRLREDLVTLDTDQEISGPLSFDGDVFVQKDLYAHGPINGVDVVKLANEAVYLNTNDTIEGVYHMESAVVAKEVAVDGLVNDIDLPAFDRNVTDFWNDAEHALVSLDRHSGDSCELLKYLQGVLTKSYYVLDSFVVHQDFGVPASHVHVISPKEISLVCADDENLTEAAAVRTTWNSTTSSFVATGETLKTTIAKTSVHKIGTSELGVYIGIQEKSSFVQLNGAPLNVNGFSEADVLVRSRDEALVALLFPKRGACEVYQLTGLDGPHPEIHNYGNATVGKGSSSVALFEMNSATYIAVSSFSDLPHPAARGLFKVLERGPDGVWQRAQRMSVAASTYVRHFVYHGYHYLVINNVAPVHESKEPKNIQIYRNSDPRPKYFSLFQKIPFDDSIGLEIFQFGDLSELHLVTWNKTRVQVLRLEGESGFRPVTALHGRCVRDVQPLIVDGHVYLAVGQHDLKGDQPATSVLYRGLTQGKYTGTIVLYLNCNRA